MNVSEIQQSFMQFLVKNACGIISLVKTNPKNSRDSLKTYGFTIVELLIVIVIIGIISTIVLVAYNGVQKSAKITVIRSDLSSAESQLEVAKVNSGNDQYPASSSGLKKSEGTVYEYSYDSGTNSYCLSATSTSDNTIGYNISTNHGLQDGVCVGHTPPGGEVVTIPLITTASLPNTMQRANYSQTVAITGSPSEFTVSTGSLPAGLSLNSTTGVVSGTPTTVATVNFTVTATNDAGADSQAYTIIVAMAPPLITTASIPDMHEWVPVNIQIVALGDSISFSVPHPYQLPILDLSSAGVITGNPGDYTAGNTYPYTVIATNSAGSDSKTFSITVLP